MLDVNGEGVVSFALERLPFLSTSTHLAENPVCPNLGKTNTMVLKKGSLAPKNRSSNNFMCLRVVIPHITREPMKRVQLRDQ